MNNDLDWLAEQRPQTTSFDAAAHDRALLALNRHIEKAPRGGLLRRRGIHTRWRLGVAGAVSLTAAVAAAVVLVGHGTPNPAVRSVGVAPVTPAAHDGVGGASSLMRLADYVRNSGAPEGDATMVARTTTESDGKSVTVYDLYADDGKYYFSRTEGGLAGQVSAEHDQAGGLFRREIEAAKHAANGDLPTAGQEMADAPNPSKTVSPTPTSAEEKRGLVVGVDLYDNYVWGNSLDALTAGAGQPQVRAGVLRLLATLPGVSVTDTTTANQPTLTLSASNPALPHNYTERLTINAETGVPVSFAGGPTGGAPSATVDYTVSRVTLADLTSGESSSN